jgi:tetratricopeptide (TPR) repeat protein
MSQSTLTSFGALDIPFNALLAYRNGRAAAIESRFRDAIACFDEALKETGLPVVFCARALEQRADCYRHLALYEKAEEDLQEALALAELPAQRARTRVHLGEVADAWGRQEEALGYFQRALEEAEIADDAQMIGRAKRGLGVVYRRRGDTDRSLEVLNQALETLRIHGDAREQARALTSCGLTHFARGEFQQAIGAYDEALRIYDSLGEQWQTILTLNCLGECHQSLYDVTTAYRYHQRAFRLAQAHHAPGMMPTICHNLGVDLMELGRHADAQAYLEQALEDATRLDRFDLIVKTLFELTRYYLRQGDRQAAERAVSALERARDKLKSGQADSIAHFAKGELLFARGEQAAAVTALQAAALSAQSALERGSLWKLHAAMSQIVADARVARVHLQIAADYIRQTAEPLEDDRLKRTFLFAPPVMAVLLQAGVDPESL